MERRGSETLGEGGTGRINRRDFMEGLSGTFVRTCTYTSVLFGIKSNLSFWSRLMGICWIVFV